MAANSRARKGVFVSTTSPKSNSVPLVIISAFIFLLLLYIFAFFCDFLFFFCISFNKTFLFVILLLFCFIFILILPLLFCIVYNSENVSNIFFLIEMFQ